ncbi:hypothetical protein [Frankia sp. Cas4]|nr:hypothetical protein [Frankia sp. Cas4]
MADLELESWQIWWKVEARAPAAHLCGLFDRSPSMPGVTANELTVLD